MEYDYVIVGAGSAGCVLANRLSADPGVSVALVEAGGQDDKLEIRMPAGFAKLFKTDYDWNYTTAKQGEMSGRELYWPRGRVLGGSSSLNAQMWVRGCGLDYDQWEVPGWSYEDVLPYFTRAERRVGSNGGDVYGTEGPLYISELRSPNVTTAAFLRACEELGLRRLEELNGRSNEGCSPTPVTQNRGRRWSSADAYLRPALKRPNLTVVTGATVDRVLFEGRRAVGVEHGGGAQLRARREVILSAGAIGSPHLLMRSGVGAAGELRDAGVEVVRDLPEVGKNLQDHLSSGVYVECKQPVTLTKAESIGNLLRYIVLRSGMLTTNVGEAVAFVRTSAEEPAPDIELIFAPGPFVDHGLTPPTGHGLTVGVVLLQPESRGRIGLNGRDPLIDPAYLSAEADVKRLVAGLKTAKQVFATAAMRPYAGGPMAPYWAPESDEELAQWVRERAETLYHPAGTCRMGADEGSVVDPTLRVRGVERLRVVDVSIMPTLNRGHTHAPAIMIGEKGADLIVKGE
ncbi:GMC family oxidoreductase N-terminal domain-containing protein [Actinomadura sp. ATCC 31491]|uniref:GMC family oxidoreductase N-terminal domain-containing protein n=1 Tax=Actinomadura luzonensis TaxID=2805427 RepID=A0ABT0FZR8_9ACTN|nr:GMC family oxidoreductase N-terminal domain-containing protein [Actinomadura luzonensis]MCK2217792.1 GMC family oxidoreductase N-terminal domain-containing protein [Actinomadura luzonensis]